MNAIEGDAIKVFESAGIVVSAARDLAAAVYHPELRRTELAHGPSCQLVADGAVIATFPCDRSPITAVPGERWEAPEGPWYLAVIEHGHWAYVFEADREALGVLDGATTCQQSGQPGEVRADHVEAVWYCIPVETFRSLWPSV